jgi:hypothetical protein
MEFFRSITFGSFEDTGEAQVSPAEQKWAYLSYLLVYML